ncbi:MAG: ribokinase [Rhodothermales bacterium]
MPKIVVVGSSNTDFAVRVEHLPGPGETVLGGAFHQAAGGKGANQAVAAARAGGEVTFVACVGEDALGDQAIEGFARDGIDTAHVFRTSEVASGVALILVDQQGENSIAVASGANAALTPDHLKQAQKAIAEADVLVVQLEIPLETVRAAVEMAARQGTDVVLNPAPAQPLDEDLLRHIAVLTPNESEAALLTGIEVDGEEALDQVAEALLAKGVGAVLITLGWRGAYVATPDPASSAGQAVRQRVPGFKAKAVDTTAAGDVFNGALVVAMAEGRPLVEAVRFANAAAALSVTKQGAQPSAPRRDAIEALLGQGGA